MVGSRIIPARAGFTGLTQPPQGVLQDHPRSRGVYFSMSSRRLHTDGSSPLARGLLVVVSGRVFSCGIIPARAGFTDTLSCHNRLVGDHPRSRGVYPARRARAHQQHGSSPLARGLPDAPVIVVDDGGSSPLARGLLFIGLNEGVSKRIIPARAGFTCPARWSSPTRPGSSPLARGLLRDPPVP